MKRETLKRKSIYLLSLILLPMVSALSMREGLSDIFGVAKDTIYAIITFVTEILLDVGQIDEFLFAKLLLFLVVFIVVYNVIKRNAILGGEKKISLVLSFLISLLSIRFIPESEIISAILIPYSTLGIAISFFLPFLIYFFFVHQSVPGSFGRRAAWITFAVFFFALWGYRSSDIGTANTIYGIGTAILVIVFLFDGSIHKYFSMSDFRRVRMNQKEKNKIEILRALGQLDDDYKKGYVTEAHYNHKKRELETKIKEFS
jgi:uncharacterized membrane protein